MVRGVSGVRHKGLLFFFFFFFPSFLSPFLFPFFARDAVYHYCYHSLKPGHSGGAVDKSRYQRANYS